ncbi:hypothetical protein D9613_010605 [Agrocybe pediades]|uniref:Uncharacterized protein n=1 Tax=Agrocybe pediades TaxID=84607 RepID=A0A8H4QFJ3_9AGAR|nr:hypothetical protein D9613_010605 [Agrocybe pediades]
MTQQLPSASFHSNFSRVADYIIPTPSTPCDTDYERPHENRRHRHVTRRRRWKEEGRDEEGNRTRSTSNVVRSTTHAGHPPLSATSPAATHAHPFMPTLERHVTTRNRAATSRVTQPPMQRVNADMRPSPPLRTSAATSPQPRKSKRPIPRHVNPSPHIEPRHVTVVNSCRPTPVRLP